MGIMHCVAHGHKIERADARMEVFQKNGTVDDVKWALDHLLQTLGERPEFIERGTKDALLSLSRAYERDGLSGALVHVDWLLSTLENTKDGEIKWAADTLRQKIQG